MREGLIKDLKRMETKLREQGDEDSVVLLETLGELSDLEAKYISVRDNLVEMRKCVFIKWHHISENDYPSVNDLGHSKKLLISFENDDPTVGRYIESNDSGGYFAEQFNDYPVIRDGLIVNAWAYLPESWKGEDKE